VPKERLTTRAFLNRVIADLDIATEELRGYDPIVLTNAANASVYLRDRTFKLNYYAVRALQARVLLYAGDKVGALAAAREVIESNVFGWTPSSEIATFDESNRNKIFTQELIFCLNISNMATVTSPFYDPEVSGNLLARSPYEYESLFDPVDYRFVYLTRFNESIWRRYSTKLIQNGSTAFSNRMPILRKAELYYIAAECLSDTDPTASIAYLDEVRRHRNLLDELSPTLTSDQIEAQIRLEYRREFIGEGQLFYYYKRKNASQIDGVYVTMNEETYVLPLPDREIFYGQ